MWIRKRVKSKHGQKTQGVRQDKVICTGRIKEKDGTNITLLEKRKVKARAAWSDKRCVNKRPSHKSKRPGGWEKRK